MKPLFSRGKLSGTFNADKWSITFRNSDGIQAYRHTSIQACKPYNHSPMLSLPYKMNRRNILWTFVWYPHVLVSHKGLGTLQHVSPRPSLVPCVLWRAAGETFCLSTTGLSHLNHNLWKYLSHPSETVRWKVTTSQFSLLCGGWPGPSRLILEGGGQASVACHSSLTFRSDNM